MNQPLTMSPDIVYNLVASNPNLKNIVEQTAKLMQMQQQAQQMAPMLQQMAQNPVGALNNFVGWQQNQTAEQQVQTQAPAPVQQQNQQGGSSMGMLEEAMAIVGEFRQTFQTLNNNLKEIHDMCAANADAIKALAEKESVPVVKGVKKDGDGK